MPAYRLRGLPQDDGRAAGLLPRVETAGALPRELPEGPCPASRRVTSLTDAAPVCAGGPAGRARGRPAPGATGQLSRRQEPDVYGELSARRARRAVAGWRVALVVTTNRSAHSYRRPVRRLSWLSTGSP